MSTKDERPARPEGLFNLVEEEPEEVARIPDVAPGRPGSPISHTTRSAKDDEGKRLYRSKKESFARLDPYYEMAVAGAELKWLQERAGVSKQSVEEWLRERGVGRARGAEAKMRRKQSKVIDALGLATESRDVLHRAEVSEFKGLWKEPEIVRRVPMNYDLFALSVHHLVENLGLSHKEVAAALGVDQLSVSAAYVVQVRHLEARSPVRCAHCGAATDPFITTGYCSKQCERLSRR